MPEATWVAAGSSIGRVRDNNEDSYLCDPERGVFIVADGMGGHADGEVASKTAIEVLDGFLSAEAMGEMVGDADWWKEFLNQGIQRAHDRIRMLTDEQGQSERGMGTTVVIAVHRGSWVHVANVGDSRAYLVRGHKPTVVSRDHSVAARMAEDGQLTPDEARSHPFRNQLTSCLGGVRDPEPDFRSVELHDDDRIVLCSDGLWDMLSDSEIACMVGDGRQPNQVVRELIEAANEAGGLDNITVVFFAPRVERRAVEWSDGGGEDACSDVPTIAHD